MEWLSQCSIGYQTYIERQPKKLRQRLASSISLPPPTFNTPLSADKLKGAYLNDLFSDVCVSLSGSYSCR